MVFQGIEDFSPEEERRYKEIFKVLVPELLKSRGSLNLENILEGLKQGFTAEEQIKLYKTRNYPMTRYLLIRTLKKLEDEGMIGFKGREYYHKSDSE